MLLALSVARSVRSSVAVDRPPERHGARICARVPVPSRVGQLAEPAEGEVYRSPYHVGRPRKLAATPVAASRPKNRRVLGVFRRQDNPNSFPRPTSPPDLRRRRRNPHETTGMNEPYRSPNTQRHGVAQAARVAVTPRGDRNAVPVIGIGAADQATWSKICGGRPARPAASPTTDDSQTPSVSLTTYNGRPCTCR